MENCKDVYGSLKLFTSFDNSFKGLIVDEHNHVLVPYYPNLEDTLITESTTLSFPLTAYKSTESSLIRAFFYNGFWTLSTSTRIQAEESNWTESASFYQLFEEALQHTCNLELDEFFQVLDTDKVYFFLLPTTGLNRIGKKATVTGEPIQLAGIYYQEELHLPETLIHHPGMYGDIVTVTPLPQPTVFSTLDEFRAAVDSAPVGYLVPDTRTRYVNGGYNSRFKLRDNRQDIHSHFIYILKNGSEEDRSTMVEMYPELEEYFGKAVEELHSKYLMRYVKRNVTQGESYDVHRFLKRCHEQYKTTYTPLRKQDVQAVLLKNSVNTILALVFSQ